MLSQSSASDYITIHPDGRIQVYDIRDAKNFVYTLLGWSRLANMEFHEREDLCAEGMLILLDLASKFKPHMDGYEQPGRFSGYAARFLPGKVRSAYYKMHPEHLQKTNAEGKRYYQHGEQPKSYEELIEREEAPINGDFCLSVEHARQVGDFVQ